MSLVTTVDSLGIHIDRRSQQPSALDHHRAPFPLLLSEVRDFALDLDRSLMLVAVLHQFKHYNPAFIRDRHSQRRDAEERKGDPHHETERFTLDCTSQYWVIGR